MSKNVAASIRARLKQHADASPETISYPALLGGLPAAQLRAYPKCTVVAEKFHALCLLGMGNTRMKDYFDLWVLLNEGTLDASELRRAVKATFARRKMALPSSAPVGLSDAFATDAAKRAQWAAFLKRNQLDAIALTEVVPSLRTELGRAGIF